ncbi:MAG: 16S rRNA (uracil(1498)-N(3))-methyltransferase [Nitrospinae bacterium]|nr:16S rRNA (uracil(1498)-N(3))-methyltransferase [Nitrospinota bacterium]
MRRFFVRPADVSQGMLRLTGDEAAHLTRVLRLSPGAQIMAFDGAAHEYAAVVERLEADTVLCRILQHGSVQPTAAIQISLGQGLPRARKLEWVIQKTTELGVAEIVPLLTERTVPQIWGRGTATKRERWEKIAREACKQCGRSAIPRVWPATALAEFFTAFQTADLKLLLWEGEHARRLRKVLAECGHVVSVAVVVGPEGGFAPQEVARGESHGFLPVGLGSRILRTETAGLVAVSLLQYRFGDLG